LTCFISILATLVQLKTFQSSSLGAAYLNQQGETVGNNHAASFK